MTVTFQTTDIERLEMRTQRKNPQDYTQEEVDVALNSNWIKAIERAKRRLE